MTWDPGNPRGNRNPRIAIPLDVGAGGALPKFNVHQFFPWGFPTAGSVDLLYAIPDPEDSDTVNTETITLPWDCDTSDFSTALLTHTSIHSTDYFTLQDGPWPYSALWLQFAGPLKGKSIALPTIDVSGLTGGLFPQVQAIRFWTS